MKTTLNFKGQMCKLVLLLLLYVKKNMDIEDCIRIIGFTTCSNLTRFAPTRVNWKEPI